VTMTDGSEKEYLSCAETAKLLRAALKRAFPGVKFSVRSDTYSGGASIRVGWTDGPTTQDVDRIAQQYAGADFDGMIDLKSYAMHWLHPDGTVSLARAEGTQGSGGYLPEQIGDPRGPTARMVRLGADFVQTDREISAEWQEEIVAELERVSGETITLREWSPGRFCLDGSQRIAVHVDQGGKPWRLTNSDGDYVADLFHRITAKRSR
jgi:Large polyvalent protein associated domain 29